MFWKGRPVWHLLLVMVCLIILFSSGSAAAQEVKSPAEVAQGVVRVVTRDPRTGNWNFNGTGFVIGREPPFQYVATNWHVVEPRAGEQQREVGIGLFADYVIPARIHTRLERTDIAILELEARNLLHEHVALEFADREMVSVGDEVFALGYPGLSFTDYNQSYTTDTTITKGVISRDTMARLGSGWDGTKIYQHDAAVNPGNSGGPLVNTRGQVVGINTRIIAADVGHGIMAAVHIDYLNEVLRSAGIAYLQAGETQPEPEEAEETGAVEEAEPEEAEEAEKPEEAEPVVAPVQPIEQTAPPIAITEPDDSGPNFMLYGGIGAGALVLIGVVLAVALSGRGGAKTAGALPPPPPAPQAGGGGPASATIAKTAAAPSATVAKAGAAAGVTRAKAAGPRPVIKGVSGRYAGQTIELVGGQLIIGRDPNVAQLVYPQSEEDISRKHCLLRYDEQSRRFALEDSSSNGTFLSTNQKLEPGKTYYLNPGEKFYLVDPKESFEVMVD